MQEISAGRGAVVTERYCIAAGRLYAVENGNPTACESVEGESDQGWGREGVENR